MLRDPRPALALIRACPDLAAGGAEIQSCRIVAVGAHRLPLHRPPGMLRRQSAIQALPARAGVTGHVNGRLAAGTGARPDFRTVHREYPGAVRIAWMQDDRKADVAYFPGRVRSDPFPFRAGTIQPIDAAMVLLIEPARIARMQGDRMWIVAVFGIRIRQEVGRDALVQRPPGCSAVRAFEHAADGNPHVEVKRVRRVNADRMQLCAIRPWKDRRLDLRKQTVVEAGDLLPAYAVVSRAEQAWRRSSRIPHARLRCMPWREPEHAFHGAGFFTFVCLPENGRLLRLGPRSAIIARAQYSRPEMTGLCGHQHRALAAGIRHQVIDDVAEVVRPLEAPFLARRVASIEECALARSDQ